MIPRPAAAAFEPQNRNVVLYRTHFWDAACARQFRALQSALGEDYDLVVSGFVAEAPAVPADIACFFHDESDLAQLGYAQSAALRPPHIDAMRFFQAYPGYDAYWFIEYDVRYTGDWAALLGELSSSPADLLATVVQRRAEHPQWAHWPGFSAGREILPECAYVKIFAPLMRLSAAALRAVDAAYKAGWSGHYEVLWPSAIAAAGLGIEEIGGEGTFTPAARRGRYYTNTRLDPYLSPGSFVFRPSLPEDEIPATPARLWHPVKSAAMSAPVPPESAPTWRDFPLLRPLRLLRQKLLKARH
jgi:hypothetical protein